MLPSRGRSLLGAVHRPPPGAAEEADNSPAAQHAQHVDNDDQQRYRKRYTAMEILERDAFAVLVREDRQSSHNEYQDEDIEYSHRRLSEGIATSPQMNG